MKVLKDFRMYDTSSVFLDTVDVTLPEIAYMTTTSSGAGIMGEIETPIIGLIQSMGITINSHNISVQQIGLIDGSTQLEFRGSEQYTDVATGEIKERSVKITTRVVPKKYSPGSLAKASEMGSSFEGEVIYLKILHDGKEAVEIDKLNYICTINGVDVMKTTRANLGM